MQVDFNTQLAELDRMQDTCKKLLQTKHYQALGEAGIHAIIARAKALGIHPFEALNGGFICIQGKVGMSTEMMAALVRQRGHSVRKDPKSNNELCILHGKRADNGDEWTCSFGKADAEAAGLWNSATWKKYPSVMLYNRCMSQLFRQLFPDISLGAGYVEDELKEITKSDEYKTIDVDVKPLYNDEKKIEVLEEKLTQSQIEQLSEVLSECDPAYAGRILEYYKVKDIGDLSAKNFELLMNKALMARENFKKEMNGE